MKFNIYDSHFNGNPKNCYYPEGKTVTNLEEFKEATAHDHVCALFKDHYRSISNFLKADCLVMDCDNDHSDNPEDWVNPSIVKASFAGVPMVIASSRHDNKPKGVKTARPRFHVYFPIKEVKTAEEYASLKRQVLEVFPLFDDKALDAARFFFGAPGDNAEWVEGEDTLESYIGFARKELLPQEITEGSRNSTLSHFAGKVIKRFGDTVEARQMFLKEADKCNPPLSHEELRSIWHSAKKFGKRVASQPGYLPPEKYNAPCKYKPGDYSDTGQAVVLSKLYGDVLCYTTATDFLRYHDGFWDESKERAMETVQELTDKQMEEAEKMEEAALELLKTSGAQAILLGKGTTKAKREFSAVQMNAFYGLGEVKSYKQFAIQRRDTRYLKSALEAVKPMVDIPVSKLDSDCMLLNTPSGTYNLRKGIMGKNTHDPKDYITKITSVSPADADMHLWKEALEVFFCGNEELIDYVQRVAGLVAIGRVYVEAMIIAYGEGRNGKSTFWNTLARVLGTYSGKISADTLTVGCKRNVKPEMAEVQGKRLLIAAELEEGMHLNTAIIKQLCSTDEIYAEKKYKSPFSFVPSHTLVLYTNHLPKVGANDPGTWRRLFLIPFNAVIEGKNDIKNYSDYLYRNAGGAILTWMIEGARKIIKEGFELTPPLCVRNAINDYREANDWLGNFIEANCEVDSSFEEKSGVLYQVYRSYCLQTGEKIRSTTDFYAALDLAGFIRRKTEKGSFIHGLKLTVNDF